MKFQVLLEGENFMVELEASPPRKHGFYVTAHVEAQTGAEAEALALGLLRANERLRAMIQNSADDRPRLRVQKVGSITEWPSGVVRPLTGLAWYEETRD